MIAPPAIQMSSAEIIEDADVILKEKKIEHNENNDDESIVKWDKEEKLITPAIVLDYDLIKEAFVEFAKNQSPSTCALINMFEPVFEGKEIRVSMHKANINLIEPIKIEWQKFLRQYLNIENLSLILVEDDTVVQQTKAYTQREHLDELIKENPLIKELVKKLNLKLK